MNWHHRKDKGNANRLAGFFTGVLAGSLICAGVMLVLAPRMGKRTRSQTQKQGAKLHHQAEKRVEEVATEVDDKAHQFTGDVHEGAVKLQQRVQDMISEGGQ